MEFGQSQNTLEMNISKTNEKSFAIEQNRKSFEILSKELYKDVEGSIIREIACNAYDSHIAAGKEDLPIKICLPTLISDIFSIEDYGTGLSEDDVYNLYTTYFRSTKDTSNDFTGAFGLGSKTPFCYTDSFSIESTFNGKRSQYIVYVDDVEGIPMINKVAEEETSDCNGFKVSFAVNEADHSVFAQKAISILKYFKVTPEVEGINSEDLKIEFFRDLETVKIRLNKDYSRKIIALMGNVAYEIDPNFIKNIKNHNHIFSSMIYKFNIGELTVTASRDSLRYDKKTLASIDKMVPIAEKEITKILGKEIEDVETLMEARLLYAQFCDKLSYLDDYNGYKAKFVKDGVNVTRNISKYVEKDEKILCRIIKKGTNHNGNFVKDKGNTIHINSNFNMKAFILIDDVKTFLVKTKIYMEEHNIGAAYHLTNYDPADLPYIYKYLGIKDCIKMSEIKLPKIEDRSFKIQSKISYKTDKRKRNQFKGYYFEKGCLKSGLHSPLDINDIEYYVSKESGGFVLTKFHDNEKSTKTFIEYMGLNNEIVAVLYPSHIKVAKEFKNNNVININDFFNNKLKDDNTFRTNILLGKETALMCDYEFFFDLFDKLRTKKSSISDTSFLQLFKEMKHLSKLNENYSCVSWRLTDCIDQGLEELSTDNKKDYHTSKDNMIKNLKIYDDKYPLLRNIDFCDVTKIDNIIDYINMIYGD